MRIKEPGKHVGDETDVRIVRRSAGKVRQHFPAHMPPQGHGFDGRERGDEIRGNRIVHDTDVSVWLYGPNTVGQRPGRDGKPVKEKKAPLVPLEDFQYPILGYGAVHVG